MQEKQQTSAEIRVPIVMALLLFGYTCAMANPFFAGRACPEWVKKFSRTLNNTIWQDLDQPAQRQNKDSMMPTFSAPMINLYSRDLLRAVAFYSGLGFVESFRTPATGEPIHVELEKDGFTLGIATVEAATQMHGLQPKGEGRWIEIVLWTDDTDAAVKVLVASGAPLLSPPHDFLDGRLRSAWIADPDGNPVQLVQRRQ